MLTLESKNNDKSHNDYRDDDFGLCKFWENVDDQVEVYIKEDITYEQSKKDGEDKIAFMFFKYGDVIDHLGGELTVEPGCSDAILYR